MTQIKSSRENIKLHIADCHTFTWGIDPNTLSLSDGSFRFVPIHQASPSSSPPLNSFVPFALSSASMKEVEEGKIDFFLPLLAQQTLEGEKLFTADFKNQFRFNDTNFSFPSFLIRASRFHSRWVEFFSIPSHSPLGTHPFEHKKWGKNA